MKHTAPTPPPGPREQAVIAAINTPLTPETLRDMLAARRQQHNGWTPIKVAAFIEALAETCSVAKAAAYVNMSAAAAYKLRNHPDAQAFREAWDSATAPRFEELTDIAMERIRNGVEKNRWWHDEKVGVDLVFSDRLLMHMLNRTDPDRVAALRAASAAQPAPAVLPMAEDFMVAAATETGKLGWDADADEVERYDDELESAMAERRAKQAAAELNEARLRAAVDARPKCTPEAAFAAELGAARARRQAGAPIESELDRLLFEDELFDSRFE